jgi:hypothetical protein
MVNFVGRRSIPFGTWGSLTCSKFTTRVKRLKVPPGGLRSLNFSVLKKSTTSAGFEPASLGSRGGNVTSRPRRPLHEGYFQLRIRHQFISNRPCVLIVFKPASSDVYIESLSLYICVFVDLKLLNGGMHLKMPATHLFCF